MHLNGNANITVLCAVHANTHNNNTKCIWMRFKTGCGSKLIRTYNTRTSTFNNREKQHLSAGVQVYNRTFYLRYLCCWKWNAHVSAVCIVHIYNIQLFSRVIQLANANCMHFNVITLRRLLSPVPLQMHLHNTQLGYIQCTYSTYIVYAHHYLNYTTEYNNVW